MSQLSQNLAAGEFVVTAEVAPPKGIDLAPVLATAEKLQGVTAVNVTDNQGANMRLCALVLAGELRRRGIEPVLQLTCRDRNRVALQSDLLGAAALGIENVLLLSGDHSKFGDHPDARPVFDLDAVQLLDVVAGLNRGVDMAGKPLAGTPRFFPGAAVNPAAEPFELVLQKVRKKVDGGARFFQTQAVFTRVELERLAAAVAPLNVPVLAGVLLVRSAKMARFLNSSIPGMCVPDEVVARLEQAADPLLEGVAIARETVGWARTFCQGVHLMTLGHDETIPEILR
ncbi:MAG: 5,10-methylenetetrahydrofolate reductase [Deltaproteobacteria bacterium]|nr:MAG: 5,10-methylenetetrahydrofolate reductase [Deltaproteobacteria bacterium]